MKRTSVGMPKSEFIVAVKKVSPGAQINDSKPGSLQRRLGIRIGLLAEFGIVVAQGI